MVLSENGTIPESENLEVIKEFQDDLLEFRDDYTNELPEKRIRPPVPILGKEEEHKKALEKLYSYKCRTTWWYGIFSTLEHFEDKISNENVLKNMDKIWEYFEVIFSPEHYSGVIYEKEEKFRTKEELDKMDELLTELINALDNLLK